uniref:Uncharacterized protein n=1 Tax=Heterorhabditis bacteriophora TaxID=37862 RepID=A0A1I7WGG1_HETBA
MKRQIRAVCTLADVVHIVKVINIKITSTRTEAGMHILPSGEQQIPPYFVSLHYIQRCIITITTRHATQNAVYAEPPITLCCAANADPFSDTDARTDRQKPANCSLYFETTYTVDHTHQLSTLSLVYSCDQSIQLSLMSPPIYQCMYFICLRQARNVVEKTTI